jgi:hypothetical protein
MHVQGFCDITLPVRHGWGGRKLPYRFLAYVPGISRSMASSVSKKKKKRCLNYTRWAIKTHLFYKYHSISSGNPCTLRKWRHETLMWLINLYFIHPVGKSPHESWFLLWYLQTTIWPKLSNGLSTLIGRVPSSIMNSFILKTSFCTRRLACKTHRQA